MSAAEVERIVEAVLYEGYMLYPYRPSSIKNRTRWTFGGLCPQAHSLAQNGAEPWSMQTQCLLEGGGASLSICLGFLHLIARQVGELREPVRDWPTTGELSYRKVEVLEIGDACHYTWQEAVRRNVQTGELAIGERGTAERTISFKFPGWSSIDPLRQPDGVVAGVVVRTQLALEARVGVSVERIAETLTRVTIRLMNVTPLERIDISRDEAMLQTLVSAHAILTVRDGEFISLLDPPETLRPICAECLNVGVWPVLVGAQGSHDMVLASPIILYDYPQIAPESPLDLFDATEVDELLMLRILTMTEQEKREMAAGDERGRALLEHIERLTPEQMQRLHGALRCPHPATPMDPSTASQSCAQVGPEPPSTSLRIGSTDLCVGGQVRLRPRNRGDILDLVLDGKLATIESIEHDYDGRPHVAVIVDDDPGKDLGMARMHGHRFFFWPEEVEPIGSLRTEQ